MFPQSSTPKGLPQERFVFSWISVASRLKTMAESRFFGARRKVLLV